MSDIQTAYAFILSAMSKQHEILMSTVSELETIRNIEMEDRTPKQELDLDTILKGRRPHENAWHRLEEVRSILWKIYEV